MKNKFYPLKNYEGLYEINRDGVIIRIERECINSLGHVAKLNKHVMKTKLDKRSGYPVVKITKQNGKDGTQYVHRLVALTFIPNPLNKPFVNHKDGNRNNYSIQNLEWVTARENYLHAVINSFIKMPFESVSLLDNCSGKRYKSIKEATTDLGINYNLGKLMIRGIIPNNTCLEKAEV